jgi:hypothetical protein
VDSNPVTINLEIGQAEQLLNLMQSGLLDGIGSEQIKRLRDATVASILRHKRDANQFDVFLCHNSVNKPEVRKIGERLKARGLLPWLDEWELRPGVPWQRTLEKQIRSIKSAAVFIGKDGRGPWQDLELESFIRQFVSRQCPVIPVLQRSCPTEPDLPTFLEGMNYVNLSKRKPDPLEQLVWGITGIHPELQTYR